MTVLSAPAVRRKPAFEEMLCKAVQQRLRVALVYGHDGAERMFDPYAIYESCGGAMRVAGNQLHDREQDMLDSLEIGKIAILRVTDVSFEVDRRFDRHDPKFAQGRVCCSV